MDAMLSAVTSGVTSKRTFVRYMQACPYLDASWKRTHGLLQPTWRLVQRPLSALFELYATLERGCKAVTAATNPSAKFSKPVVASLDCAMKGAAVVQEGASAGVLAFTSTGKQPKGYTFEHVPAVIEGCPFVRITPFVSVEARKAMHLFSMRLDTPAWVWVIARRGGRKVSLPGWLSEAYIVTPANEVRIALPRSMCVVRHRICRC